MLPSCYKIALIARACAVIKSRKKSQKRRGVTIMKKHLNNNNNSKPLRPMVCLISGFFITMKGRLFIPLARDKYFDVQLNRHVHDRCGLVIDMDVNAARNILRMGLEQAHAEGKSLLVPRRRISKFGL